MLKVAFLTAAVVLAGEDMATRPPAGSNLPPDANNCATCHGEPDLWEGDTKRLFIPKEHLAEDVHFRNGVNCHDCHGGNPGSLDVPEAHSTVAGDQAPGAAPFRKMVGRSGVCVRCHQNEETGLIRGVHGKAEVSDEKGGKSPFTCATCHGEAKHRLPSLKSPKSPLFPASQITLCGGCHSGAVDTYRKSVHGHGLEHSGLLVTAVCSSCHGAHDILPAKDEQSLLSLGKVAATCAKCHRFIEERLKKSVHGGGRPEDKTNDRATGSKGNRRPGCTDCHQGHDLPHPQSADFRLISSDRCGGCHEDLSDRYGLSMHGELTELSYESAAKCSDCHGAHDVVAVADGASKVSLPNRLKTCRQCHPSATPAFADFDPHSDHRDGDRDPLLHAVYLACLAFLFATFGAFGLHSLLWMVRGLVEVRTHGRPRALARGETAYVRFGHFHRIAHTIMVVSFLGLALTGLPLKYSQTEWAQVLARSLGGFESTGLWHRIFGVVNIGCLAVYVARMGLLLLAGRAGGQSLMSIVFGPNSPVPTFRDVKDCGKMLRWFVGLGPKPQFERWSYWEKFDFWGACADIVIIGFTGLILWFPALFCTFLPGAALNVAKVIHSTQALLATSFVFAIHFFNTHLRPEKFPMDMSVLTGLVSEEDFRHERPEYFERLDREGKLEEHRTTAPSRASLALVMLGGFLTLAVGLGLLVGILAAAIQ